MKPTEQEISAVKNALPLGGMQIIHQRMAHLMGYSYALIVRTLDGDVQRWNERHERIITEARKLIAERSKAAGAV